MGVLSIITGAVRSQGQTYFDDWKLPEDSMYKSIEGIIKDRAKGNNDGLEREPTKVYAKNVVEDILARKSGKVWRGANAGATKFSSTWLPQSMMVSFEEDSHLMREILTYPVG